MWLSLNSPSPSFSQVFEVPTAKYASHQVKHSLPYFFSRYVFRNKHAQQKQLYDFQSPEDLKAEREWNAREQQRIDAEDAAAQQST